LQKDELHLDLANKNKQIALLQSKYESVENKLNKKLENNQRLKSDLENVNNKYTLEINDYKTKIIKSEDDLLTIKVEYDKKIALSDQNNKFNKKQIEDLTVALTDAQKRYEDALKNSSDKDDSKLLRDTLERISKEKNEYLEKYDIEKRKSIELETRIKHMQSNHDKDVTSLKLTISQISDENKNIVKQ